jgi:hypothetical protein
MRQSYEAQVFLIVELTQITEMFQEFTHQIIGDDIFNVDKVLAFQLSAFCHTHG